jgi:hypothetical protein
VSALGFETYAAFGARRRRLCCSYRLMWSMVFIACLSPSAVLASPDAPANAPGADVKALCEHAADQWFKKNYPLPDEQTPMATGKATYTSHFSATKSNCFMEAVAVAHIKGDGETPPLDSEMHRLIDLKTGEQIGQLVIQSTYTAPLWCEVDKVKCGSAEEWGALVDVYMKD